MVTDAEIQEILQQNEPGLEIALAAYDRALDAYVSASQVPQAQIVASANTSSS